MGEDTKRMKRIEEESDGKGKRGVYFTRKGKGVFL